MAIFKFEEMTPFGKVQSVDTSTIVVFVTDSLQLSRLQVNHLVAIRSSKSGQALIGMVNKIIRKYDADIDEDDENMTVSSDAVKVILIGTLLDRVGTERNVFKRTLESVPEVDSDCFIISDNVLSEFMSVISGAQAGGDHPLQIGTYAINENTKAYLDGNRLFQRHAVIVGSTGSGKSYTVAKLIEEVAKLKSCNAILLDIHGEYEPLEGDGIKHYKIAGPSDTAAEDILFLPYWLLTYEEMQAMLIDRSDNNAPNQAMMFSQSVLKTKKSFLEEIGQNDLVEKITLDSPTPYRLSDVLDFLVEKNTEMVPGSGGREKQGDYYGKLSRFIQRLEAKISDKRLNFMFSDEERLLEFDFMEKLCRQLMSPASQGGGVKILNLSEVPSDILPLIVSLVARIVFSVQQWMEKTSVNPLAIFCDEAHLYIPANTDRDVDRSSLQSFERIAKEGRKYGIGLVIVSQRPSEVNRTVLSQSSNFIAMRLTNADDQAVIRKLFPDSIGNYADLLPVLDVGEAIAVGDASLLPSRIVIDEPSKKPNSATVRFWDRWSEEEAYDALADAVSAMRRQGR